MFNIPGQPQIDTIQKASFTKVLNVNRAKITMCVLALIGLIVSGLIMGEAGGNLGNVAKGVTLVCTTIVCGVAIALLCINKKNVPANMPTVQVSTPSTPQATTESGGIAHAHEEVHPVSQIPESTSASTTHLSESMTSETSTSANSTPTTSESIISMPEPVSMPAATLEQNAEPPASSTIVTTTSEPIASPSAPVAALPTTTSQVPQPKKGILKENDIKPSVSSVAPSKKVSLLDRMESGIKSLESSMKSFVASHKNPSPTTPATSTSTASTISGSVVSIMATSQVPPAKNEVRIPTGRPSRPPPPPPPPRPSKKITESEIQETQPAST